MRYIQILLRRKWVILITTLVAIAVAVAGTNLLPTTYTAKTVLRVLTPPSGSLSMLQYDLRYADRILATYMAMAVSEPVMEDVMAEFALDMEPDISVEVLANTELMEISVTNEDPVLAKNIANAVAEILIQQSQDTYSGSGRTATEILAEQVEQLQQELEDAQQEYEALLSEPEPNEERLAIARSSLVIKEQIYASRVTQYEEARAADAFRANVISVFNPARVPEDPSGLPNFVIIGLGGFLGVIGGLGLAFLFENFDTRLYTEEQIEVATELPVMGKIPSTRMYRQAALFNHHSYEEESFRRLRTNLFPARRNPDALVKIKGVGPTYAAQLNDAGIHTYRQLASVSAKELEAIFDAPKWRAVDTASWIEQAKALARDCNEDSDEGCLRTLLITSAKPREGKSTVAANLAFALAKSGQSILLIDGDLRLPRLHTIFNLANETGLSSVLKREAELESTIQDTTIDGIRVLTSGPPASNSSELLDSPLMRSIIQHVINDYDVVIIDSPALLAVTDAATLAPVVDGVVLVVRRVNAQQEDVDTALEQLANVKAEPIGVVINRARKDINRRYYRHYKAKQP